MDWFSKPAQMTSPGPDFELKRFADNMTQRTREYRTGRVATGSRTNVGSGEGIAINS